MCAAVDGQGAALNEGLVARFVIARVGTFVGMYSIVALEVRFSIEALYDAIAISVMSCVGDRNWHEQLGGFTEGSHTFGQPWCQSHWKGRAAMSAAKGPPLTDGLCLVVALSTILVDSRRKFERRQG